MNAAAVIIVGAGGHATVVADALLARGVKVLGFTDADSTRHSRELCGLPVLGDDAILEKYNRAEVRLANGIGSSGQLGATQVRHKVQSQLAERGWRFTAVLHPECVISRFASVDASAQVFAGGVVQAGARVEEGCIINTGAIVEHDVTVGRYSHIAPRAVVCGDVTIGENSHIGAGAVIRQGLRLGAETLVGLGAVVVKDCEGHCVLVGVPAKAMEQS
jgi:sugar O-acyltransferase (sialic acid O-acetyltransferase NeuD family)